MNRDGAEAILRIFGYPRGGRRTAAGEWINMPCPFAKWRHDGGTESGDSFGAFVPDDETEYSTYRCFGCGAGGRLVYLGKDLVEEAGHHFGSSEHEKAVNQAIEWEDEEDGKDLSAAEQLARAARKFIQVSSDDPEIQVLPELALQRFTGDYPPKAEDYLVGRGMRVAEAQQLGLLYDEEEERIIFPIRRPHGELSGMSGRSINEIRFRIKDYHFKKSLNVLGIDKLMGARGAVLVEGLFGWGFASLRLPRGWVALSTLGASVSPEQAKMIRDYLTGPLILLYDPDKAGKLGSRRAVRNLSEHGVRLHMARWPKGKFDADQLTETDWAEIVLSAGKIMDPFEIDLTFRTCSSMP